MTVSFRRNEVTEKSLIELDKVSSGPYPLCDPEAQTEGRQRVLRVVEGSKGSK
jgi:hypothetical protein